MTRNMKLVQAAASFALTGTGGSCSAVVDLVSVLKGLSIVCWAIPSGPLLVRPYPFIGERYMGNKYHILHRHLSRLSRLSRRDDLELGVAVTSIHRAAEKNGVLGNSETRLPSVGTRRLTAVFIVIGPRDVNGLSTIFSNESCE